jgi:hypothetical protein
MARIDQDNRPEEITAEFHVDEDEAEAITGIFKSTLGHGMQEKLSRLR